MWLEERCAERLAARLSFPATTSYVHEWHCRSTSLFLRQPAALQHVYPAEASRLHVLGDLWCLYCICYAAMTVGYNRKWKLQRSSLKLCIPQMSVASRNTRGEVVDTSLNGVM